MGLGQVYNGELIKAEIIPDAGHDLTVVQAEMVNQKFLDFLEKQ